MVAAKPSCPADVDLFEPGAQEFWFEAYRILHEQAPVVQLPGGGVVPGTDAFVITKYDDISRILRDPVKFPTPGDYAVPPYQQAVFRAAGFGQLVDARETLRPNHHAHQRHRRQLTGPWVGPAGAERNREMIRDHARALLDCFPDDGEVEFDQAFAAPLSQRVIATMLGFPLKDMPKLREWAETQVSRFVVGRTHRNLLPDEQDRENAKALVQFNQYIQEQIDDKRQNPQNDMISFLTNVVYEDRRLTDGEIMSVVISMHNAGSETTQHALTSECMLLAQNSKLWTELKADRAKVHLFVEEALRAYAPTQGFSFRLSAEDVEIQGVRIPRESLLHIRYGSGNRDPEQFANPELIDLTRAHISNHLAFSLGLFSCPGAGLSRLEQNVAINLLLDRFDAVELVPGKNDFTHKPGIMLALNSLYVRFARGRI
ncbi:MAG: cytochrome P450 [Dehalococcoidia bacterium]